MFSKTSCHSYAVVILLFSLFVVFFVWFGFFLWVFFCMDTITSPCSEFSEEQKDFFLYIGLKTADKNSRKGN